MRIETAQIHPPRAFIIIQIRVGEMATGKNSHHKPEDLSLNAQKLPNKITDLAVYNPSSLVLTQETEIEFPEVLGPASLIYATD